MTPNNEFRLPSTLELMIASGVWPATPDRLVAQNIEPIISDELVRKLFPGQSTLILYPPPFLTISDMIRAGETFWVSPEASCDQIDVDRTLAIGDFGVGSDALIALQYRLDDPHPSVVRFKWSEKAPRGKNEWVTVTSTFDDFVDLVGLRR